MPLLRECTRTAPLQLCVLIHPKVSGWWSYSFCHNREVRQFHHLPAQVNNQWPPTEDPDTQSYVLGRVAPEDYDKSDKGVGTELQTTGDLRYLVQKLGGGTTCDLTGKDRKIEVQVSASRDFCFGYPSLTPRRSSIAIHTALIGLAGSRKCQSAVTSWSSIHPGFAAMSRSFLSRKTKLILSHAKPY